MRKVIISKRIVMLCVVVLLAIGGFLLIQKVSESNNLFPTDNSDSSLDSRENSSYSVDKRIAELTESDEYKAASTAERVDMVKKLLNQLKKENLIRHFEYDGENELFSFEYADGTLGGIMVQDFSPYFD